jgi:hypothetical protein
MFSDDQTKLWGYHEADNTSIPTVTLFSVSVVCIN